MDIFNTKKIEALEARIKALEPVQKSPYDESDEPTVQSLEKRIKALEDEVLPETFQYKPRKLTLRDKVERLCSHLKIQFVTEPQRTVIKPVKKAKA